MTKKHIKTNFLEFTNATVAKGSYKLDHYPVDYSYSPDVTVEMTRYWIQLFTHNRLGVWKGILRLELNTTDIDKLALEHLNGVEGENIVLPIRVRDEEQQPTTQESMFNFLRMSDGGFNRIDSLLSEVEIVTRIAIKVLGEGDVDFSPFLKHKNIRLAISEIVPGFEKMAES